MSTHLLRSIVGAAVIAALPAAAVLAGCAEEGDSLCYEPVEVEVTLAPPFDPPMHLRVESCRLDAGACRDLCLMVMDRDGIPGPFAGCVATFRDPQIDLRITYHDETDHDRCEVLGGFLEDRAP